MPVNIESICKAHFGAHYCLFYRSRKDLVSFLAQYFTRGVENGEYCMLVTADDEVEKLARKKINLVTPDACNEGVKIIPAQDWYLKGGCFEIDRVCQDWAESLRTGLIQGSRGIRVSGDLGWSDDSIWHTLMDYEARLNDIIPYNKFIAVCSYPLENLSASQLVEIIKRHQLTIANDGGKWQVYNTLDPDNLPGFLGRASGVSDLKLGRDIIFGYPAIYPEKCNGCALCIDVCQEGLLFMENQRIAIRAGADCDWCGSCEQVCPAGAISCPFDII